MSVTLPRFGALFKQGEQQWAVVSARDLWQWMNAVTGKLGVEGSSSLIEIESEVDALETANADLTGRMEVVEAAVGVTPDTTDLFIGSYAPGSFTIPTGQYAVMSKQLQLTGSQSAVLAGTATLRVT